MNRYDQYTAIAEQEQRRSSFEREWTSERNHLHTVEAGAWLPALQSLIGGTFVGICAIILSVYLGWQKPVLIGLFVCFIVVTAIFLILLARWLNLTAPIERITGWDINQDGWIGEAVEPEQIEITVRKEDGGIYRGATMLSIGMTAARFRELCQGAYRNIQANNNSFSEAQWVGRDKLFSNRNEFVQLRDQFIRRGVLEWANPDRRESGTRFTQWGIGLIKGFAKETPEQISRLAPTLLGADEDENGYT